jgi:hypothetical protein
LAENDIVRFVWVESFVETLAFFTVFDLVAPVLKINPTTVESPGARIFFWTGVFVHPQVGFTLRILSVSVPIFFTKKSCWTVLFCGTFPKSHDVTGMEILGLAMAIVARKTSININNKTLRILPTPNLLVKGFYSVISEKF